jgi:hypothetical protein
MAVGVLLIASCASNSNIRNEYRAETFSGPIKNILVVSTGKDRTGVEVMSLRKFWSTE